MHCWYLQKCKKIKIVFILNHEMERSDFFLASSSQCQDPLLHYISQCQDLLLRNTSQCNVKTCCFVTLHNAMSRLIASLHFTMSRFSASLHLTQALIIASLRYYATARNVTIASASWRDLIIDLIYNLELRLLWQYVMDIPISLFNFVVKWL